MKYDYKTIGIIILSVLATILLVVLLIPKKDENPDYSNGDDDVLLVNINDVVFKLLGDVNYELNSNEEYKEPGYVAYIKNGSDLKEFVTIKDDNVIENGQYKIKYYLEYENIKKTLTRNIIVKNTSTQEVEVDEGENITLKLNGDEIIYVLKDNKYKELGASAIDSKTGDISSSILINGKVDTSITGEYTITYSVTNKSNETKQVNRKVIVYDLDYNIAYEKSNNKVNIVFTVNDDYIKYVNINGEVKNISKGKNNFIVDDNKEYTLIILDKYNYSKEEKVNFIKPVITCSATAGTKNTIVTVSTNSTNITKYNYYFNNQKYESTKTNYTISGNYTNVSVEAINSNNNSSKVNCDVTVDVPYFDSGLKELKYNTWDYYLYVPSNVRQNEKKPLIVFLHGSGERGNNLKSLDAYGFSKYIKSGQTYDAFILIPQLPKGKYWANETSTTMALIKKIVNDYNIDESKISLSGFSLGAIAIPTLMKQNQNYFSSVVLIACGGDKKSYAPYFKNIPVRFYTGSKDTSLGNSSNTKAFYQAVKKINSNTEWVVYNNKPHNVVDLVLKDGSVYKWMIAQTKK
ncbi:MAG: DUF5011 domain-containing protein [Bacilli bacterium]|nr:DUF5011 domain-containing protein [Bacilli bacterium]